MDKCGTYAGYQEHVAGGTPSCGPCRAAAREYRRRWRAARPEKQAALAAKQNLRQRALRILGDRHAGELRRIIADLSEVGHG